MGELALGHSTRRLHSSSLLDDVPADSSQRFELRLEDSALFGALVRGRILLRQRDAVLASGFSLHYQTEKKPPALDWYVCPARSQQYVSLFP